MTDEETASLFCLARRAADKIMGAFKPNFVCLYARGRRIPHTHVFLIPAHEGDVLDRFYNAMEKFQESPQELAQLKTKDQMLEAMRLLLKTECQDGQS